MNFEELDIALEELETRLERLRALYEQYFLGFEKIEPAVARKDVDRRIYLLRREKIRNTGKRFKLQTIIQRYNTFQQYWQRICREIENGTYKRHLARAERILGPEKILTIAARRRFGKAAAEQLAAQAEVEDASPLDEIEADDDDVPTIPPPPPQAKPDLRADRAPLPPIPSAGVPIGLPMSATVPPNAPPRTARPSKYESLKLEMNFDSWNPETSVRARHGGKLPSEAEPRAKSAPEAAPSPRPKSEPFLPAKSDPQSAPPPPLRPPSEPFLPSKSSPSAAPPPRPAPPPKPAKPAVAPRPVVTISSAPPKPPPIAKPAPAAPKPAPPKPAPAAQKPAAKPAAAASAKASTLSDDRIRELHENLVRIKRENKEAGQVSVESLAKTLRATEEKLRAEHKNRRIEFEVVLRDGKAVVKPKVR